MAGTLTLLCPIAEEGEGELQVVLGVIVVVVVQPMGALGGSPGTPSLSANWWPKAAQWVSTSACRKEARREQGVVENRTNLELDIRTYGQTVVQCTRFLYCCEWSTC